MKSHPQKNTLLKNAQANAKGNFFKRVFFSPTQEEFFPSLFFLIFFSPTHGFTANTNSCASNVNRFEQTVCGLQTTPLRTDRRASGNKGFKEIGGSVVNWNFVHLIKCSGRLTIHGSETPTSCSCKTSNCLKTHPLIVD